MKVDQKRRWNMFVVAGAAVALVAGMAATVPNAYAGGTIKGDDDKWISVGMGIRTSFAASERGAPDGDRYDNQFQVNNARIYINGKIHKYVGFTFNTECFACGGDNSDRFGSALVSSSASSMGLIDAIGKFEINELVNFWVGRTLVPTERGELNGPFYHSVFDGFRTPFFPADHSANFGTATNGFIGGNDGAGLYGRDNGAVFFGKVHPGGTHLLYVGSVFTGLRGASNQGASIMYAGRLQWNLLNDEDNPGYYTSGTYYGTAGDILALAVGVNHQKDGAGTVLNKSDFTGLVGDVLFEKVLPNNGGVFTFNGEFKQFWAQNKAAYTDASNVVTGSGCFCLFNGNSYYLEALYLLPTQIGIGKFQPYGRFTSIHPLHDSSMREEWELGTNYIIAGHNARISAYWRYGDIATKGFVGGAGGSDVYLPGRTGNKIDTFTIALQMQY